MAYITSRRLLLLRRSIFPPLLSHRNLSVSAAADSQLDSNHNSSSSSAADDSRESSNGEDAIFVKTRDKTSVTMPSSFMTGSIVGKRFYEQVLIRLTISSNVYVTFYRVYELQLFVSATGRKIPLFRF